MTEVTWRDLRVGDTVSMGLALMTLVKREGLVYTWLMHEIARVCVIDYAKVEIDVPVNLPHVHVPTALVSRIDHEVV